MRILILILCLWMPAMCFSQGDKPPSAKEIEAQKQEALNDARQEVINKKKEIADAKAGKADAEDIQQMEKELTILENMVAMLERTFGPKKPDTKAQPTKPPEDKWISPFTPTGVKRPVKIPTEAEATDMLFWYRGKKIDANTLVTTSGTIVRYDRASGQLIYEPAHERPDSTNTYYGLIHTLKQTKQMQNLFVDQADGLINSFFNFPQVQGGYDEFERLRGRFTGMAGNVYQVKTLPTSPQPDLRKMIDDVTNYANNLRPVTNIMIPPKNPVGKCLCELKYEAARHNDDLKLWVSNFYEEELKIITGLADIFEAITAFPGRFPPSAYRIDQDRYLTQALTRANQKLEKLLNEYQRDVNNVVLEDGLVCAKRNLEQWIEEFDLKAIRKALNGQLERSESLFKQVKDAVFNTTFRDFIDYKKNFKDFNAVFDHLFYVSHEYNKRVLSPGYAANTNIHKWLKELEDFNRFTLSTQLKFEYEMEPQNGDPLMTAGGEFQSQNITVSLGVEECFFNLRVTDANYQDRSADEEEFKIPMQISNASKRYIPGKNFPYTGPPKAMMLFPRFKLNFCNDPSEVKMNLLTYTMDDIARHKNDDPKTKFSIDLLAYANKMFLGLVKTSSNPQDLLNIADKALNINNGPAPPSTGNRRLDGMNVRYLMNRKRYDLEYHLKAASHTDVTVIDLGRLSSRGSPIIAPRRFNLVDPNDKDKVVKVTQAFAIFIMNHTPK